MQQVNAEKDKLFSIISHDLRSPFSAMVGVLDVLHDEIDDYDKSEIIKTVSLIKNTAQGTFKLLTDLLEWTNFHREQIVFIPKKIHLRCFTTIKISVMQNFAAQKEIEIENNISEKIEIFADETNMSNNY